MLSTEEPQSFYSAFCSLLRCKVAPDKGRSMCKNQRQLTSRRPCLPPGSGIDPLSVLHRRLQGLTLPLNRAALLRGDLLLRCITALSVAPQARKRAA